MCGDEGEVGERERCRKETVEDQGVGADTKFFFLRKRRPPKTTRSRSSAASDVYKRRWKNNPASGKTIRQHPAQWKNNS